MKSPFCLERLTRLQAVLLRHDGALSARDLTRTYGIKSSEIDQASRLGWVRCTVHRKPPPARGRPSRLVEWLVPDPKENLAPRMPPSRRELPVGLSSQHRTFLEHYWCKGGISIAIPGFDLEPGIGSARSAYRIAFGSKVRRASLNSASARLSRQPWIEAARLYRIRVQTPPAHYPADMRSEGAHWLGLIAFLDSLFRYAWPPDVTHAVKSASTIKSAVRALSKLDSMKPPPAQAQPNSDPRLAQPGARVPEAIPKILCHRVNNSLPAKISPAPVSPHAPRHPR